MKKVLPARRYTRKLREDVFASSSRFGLKTKSDIEIGRGRGETRSFLISTTQPAQSWQKEGGGDLSGSVFSLCMSPFYVSEVEENSYILVTKMSSPYR